MKRFASHYLFLPAAGFVRQQVVEVSAEGSVRRVFPLTEEIESVEWLPGVIALLSGGQIEEIKNIGIFVSNIPMFQIKHPNVSNQSSQCFQKALSDYEKRGEALFPVLLYPFDFTSMQPVAGTRHRLLR